MRGHLQQRQDLLERLATSSASITRRAPLADVLATITRAARDLLDVEIAAVRLVDPDSPAGDDHGRARGAATRRGRRACSGPASAPAPAGARSPRTAW